jgi:hypothetical protein
MNQRDRLLIDKNLLVNQLAGVFPGSAHLRDVNLKGTKDQQLCTFAATIRTGSAEHPRVAHRALKCPGRWASCPISID